MLHDKLYTKEKVEKNFATNTLAVYYLSRLTLPLMTP
jgi:NAD(P)-dependent dehydrogenase (short-subunit alcohol dehydrogenase family)